jgi:hypothetical protein
MKRIVVLGVALCLAGTRAGAQAQDVTVRTVIEYIAGGNVYLGLGTTRGLFAGDTVDFRNAGATPRTGRFRIVSSTKERAVVAFAGTPFALTRGDTILITIAHDRWARAGAAADTSPNAIVAAGQSASPPTPQRPSPRASLPPRIDGTLSIDFDALTSDTRWGDAPEDHVERRFLTPALRLHATAAQLPGGLRFNTSLRYEYRNVQDASLPGSSARIYQASLEKSFETVPLGFQLGRFYNPADLYGGYWDGALVRVRGGGLSAGVAAGFEPDRVNGGFSTARRKSSVFVEVSARGAEVGYQNSLAVHDAQSDSGEDTRYLSLSQRLRLGRATLLQRVRVDAENGWGGWNVSHLDGSLLLPVAGPLMLRAHYQRRSFDWLPQDPDTVRPHQQRAGAGLLISSARVNLTADASVTRWSDGPQTRSYSGSIALSRLLAGIGLGASGSWWAEAGTESYYISPFLERAFGRARANLAYQRYDAGPASRNEAAVASLSFPMPGNLYTSIRASTQWGSGSSQRLFMTLARSF